MEERKEDLRLLKQNAIDVFVKKEVELDQTEVIAEIISAVSGMSIAADYDRDAIRESLLEAFDALDNEEVADLCEMGPQFVRLNIGYSVDFEDYGAACAEYKSDPMSYNSVFGQAQYLNDTKDQMTL